jgi:fructose-1,6-bisphosphatase/inositol monophosphatase family enzyme
MNNYETELSFAIETARKAGETMRQYFDGGQQREIKEDGSPVTVADKLINHFVIEALAHHLPNDGLIGEEESTTEYGSGRKWFCDPIDGTIAYTWGVPTSMFSLGLVEDGVPVLGVVYDPYLDRMYHGIKGQGSFCNDQPLHVSDGELDGNIVAITSDIRKAASGQIPYLKGLTDSNAYLACFSGAVYKATLVARGRFVGYVEHGVNGHDMAAVQVIVEEAGGKITAMDGSPLDYTRPFKGAVTSNGIVHDELVQLIS